MKAIRNTFRLALPGTLIALFATSAMAAWFGNLFAGSAPPLGAKGGSLLPCPDKPNCVSSQSRDEQHAIAPLRYTGAPEAALARLADIVATEPGATVVARQDGYLRAQFVSRIMGFVDDVEFVADPAAGVVHVRSASRIGYSDLGVNRKRIEKLRGRFVVPTP